jgi:hypothetical protein
MRVSFAEAVKIFESLPGNLQIPSLHPAYIVADACRDQELTPAFWVYRAQENLYYHGFHVGIVPRTDYFDIQSPYGYGGPVATTDEQSFLHQAWEAFSSWCVQHRILAEFVRFHPLAENWHYYGGEVIDDRQTVWIDLRLDDILMSFSTRVRTAVRKAAKSGIRVEWWDKERFMEIFPALYNATMQQLNADEFYYFTNQYYDRLLRWEQAHCAVCLHGEEVVGAGIFLIGPTVMEYHLSASNETGKKLGATNLLLHEAAIYGQNSGCKALHLGGGTDNRLDNSLLFFKAGFSQNFSPFKIGKNVNMTTEYNQLKGQWQEEFGKTSNRILFYRF